jgi:hypothetical protein
MYQKPAMGVVILHQQAHLLAGSNFTTISTNLDSEDDFIFGGSDEGYTGGAH